MLAILIVPPISANLPIAFTTDSNSKASCLISINPLSFIDLHWTPFPLTILINPRPTPAIGLHVRFKQRGILADLDEAIKLHRTALALRPPDHSDRSTSLDNIAMSLRARFEQRGEQRASCLTSMRPLSCAGP
ncbi:hypothetical protein EDB19DRAFT_1322197 [Suillus lakei]|nr:hypothetical protein EDB19DRAFT_1322197 [Suillus lakei]